MMAGLNMIAARKRSKTSPLEMRIYIKEEAIGVLHCKF